MLPERGEQPPSRSGREQPVRRPRGRPPGSGSLTPEIQNTIVAFIRAGAFAEVAAQAGGISPRTFHDWMARGQERHPTRVPTKKLRAFAHAVNVAKAEARLDAEVRVFRERPLAWLSRVARSAPELPGWTELPKEQDSSPSQHLAELIMRLDEEVLEERERYQQASCSDDDCECQFHIRRRNGERYPPELR